MITLKQLAKIYGDSVFYVEVKDLHEVRKMQDSKLSCCWGEGQRYGDTGWVKLCHPGGRGGKPTVFVCREEVYRQAAALQP